MSLLHVPLCLEARAEAGLFMFSETNLLSPAIGDPISIPTLNRYTNSSYHMRLEIVI
jgi:DNA-directed RNA polymerase beta' subunit